MKSVPSAMLIADCWVFSLLLGGDVAEEGRLVLTAVAVDDSARPHACFGDSDLGILESIT